MKHGKRFWQKSLNRAPGHRENMIRNLATQLILHERIETTVPRAKVINKIMNDARLILILI